MEELSTTENIILSLLTLGILFFFIPSAKTALAESRKAKKEWAALLLPLGLVIAFVIFLIVMVKA